MGGSCYDTATHPRRGVNPNRRIQKHVAKSVDTEDRYPPLRLRGYQALGAVQQPDDACKDHGRFMMTNLPAMRL